MTVDTRPDQLGMGLLDLKGKGFDADEANHRETQLVLSGLVLALENADIPNSSIVDSGLEISDKLGRLFSSVDYGLFLDKQSRKLLVITQTPDDKKSPEDTLRELEEKAKKRKNGQGHLLTLRAGELVHQLGHDMNEHVFREIQRFETGGHEYLGTFQVMQVLAEGMSFVPLVPKPNSSA